MNVEKPDISDFTGDMLITFDIIKFDNTKDIRYND